jgi:hypothetical protein
VPIHLRDASYKGAAKLGHGKGYEYPHSFPGHHVAQPYLPDSVKDRRFYDPSDQGYEREIGERGERWLAAGKGEERKRSTRVAQEGTDVANAQAQARPTRLVGRLIVICHYLYGRCASRKAAVRLVRTLSALVGSAVASWQPANSRCVSATQRTRWRGW